MNDSVEQLWSKLAATLVLRRNLQSAMTPPERIGSRGGGGNPWSSPKDREEALQASRERHRQFIQDIMQAQELCSEQQLARRIEEVRTQEDSLWKQCRPDLYGTP